jgi:hypothetical protein
VARGVPENRNSEGNRRVIRPENAHPELDASANGRARSTLRRVKPSLV